MEWHTILQGVLSSSPVAAALGFACYKLWGKAEAQAAEIQRLNEARVEDLRAIARQND